MTPTNEAIGTWVIENASALAEFHDTFERLSYEGKCDAVGGMEHERILADWISEGCPADIENYILFAQDRDISLVLNHVLRFGL
jgi:hypothetical protein